MTDIDKASIVTDPFNDTHKFAPSLAGTSTQASTFSTASSAALVSSSSDDQIELNVFNQGTWGMGDKYVTGPDEKDIRYRVERKRPNFYTRWEFTLRTESPEPRVICTIHKKIWAMSFTVALPDGVDIHVQNGFYYSMCQEFTSEATKRSYKCRNLGSLPGSASRLGLFDASLPIESQTPLARWESARNSMWTSGKVTIDKSVGEDFDLILAVVLTLADIGRERRGSY